MLRSFIALTAVSGLLLGLSGCGVTQTKEEARADFCLFHPTTCAAGTAVKDRVETATDAVKQRLPQ